MSIMSICKHHNQKHGTRKHRTHKRGIQKFPMSLTLKRRLRVPAPFGRDEEGYAIFGPIRRPPIIHRPSDYFTQAAEHRMARYETHYPRLCKWKLSLSTNPQTRSRLFTKLPPEIRLMIYEYALCQPDGIPLWRGPSSANVEKRQNPNVYYKRRHENHLQRAKSYEQMSQDVGSILCTCKRLYMEARDLLFTTNTFKVLFLMGGDENHISRPLRKIAPLIQHLEIELSPDVYCTWHLDGNSMLMELCRLIDDFHYGEMLRSLRIYINCNEKQLGQTKSAFGISCLRAWIAGTKACLKQLSNFHVAGSVLVGDNFSELLSFPDLGCTQGQIDDFKLEDVQAAIRNKMPLTVPPSDFEERQRQYTKGNFSMHYLGFPVYRLGPVQEWYDGTWDVVDSKTQIFG
ncbi:hypothetical protein NA57DRAFT_82105 [Rhizodiscina lignyota]|uniref:DUF7730 domain-containing protein n=1 Tax=Rhizodiscina lignyota TaxID=1504668 RepID=A0A9P4M0Q8_9PEZI|nr:hypothetical protein NA57DRAFT_82105 [Rhizodiscina lignyota]